MKNLKSLPLKSLIKRIENAPDFGYDDESAELTRRGIKARWVGPMFNQKIEIIN